MAADPMYRLNPSNPFEQVLIEMAEMHKRKGGDYASERDRYSNFRETGEHIGVPAFVSNEVMVQTKQSRIKQLIQKWRRYASPNNESMEDSLIDRAVYSVIALVLWREQASEEQEEGFPNVSSRW